MHLYVGKVIRCRYWHFNSRNNLNWHNLKLKWLRHFFMGNRGRFKRGFNGVKCRVGCYSRVWAVAASMWAIKACMWTAAACIWAVKSSMSGVTSSMHDTFVLCGLLNPLCMMCRRYTWCAGAMHDVQRYVGCYNLYVWRTCAMWAVTASTWVVTGAVTGAVWALTSSLHSTQALCGLLNPLCMICRRYMG